MLSSVSGRMRHATMIASEPEAGVPLEGVAGGGCSAPDPGVGGMTREPEGVGGGTCSVSGDASVAGWVIGLPMPSASGIVKGALG